MNKQSRHRSSTLASTTIGGNRFEECGYLLLLRLRYATNIILAATYILTTLSEICQHSRVITHQAFVDGTSEWH